MNNLISRINSNDETYQQFEKQYSKFKTVSLYKERDKIEIKLYENEHTTSSDFINIIFSFIAMVVSVISLIVSINGYTVDISLLLYVFLIFIFGGVHAFIMVKVSHREKTRCLHCKIALKCIDNIIKKRKRRRKIYRRVHHN